MSLGVIFLSEVVGTAMLILLGCGVVANTALAKTKGNGTGFLFVNWGWGLAVFAGDLVSYKSGGHLNPAVTIGIASSGAKEFVPGIAVGVASILVYIAAQMLGAIIGAALCWLAYKDHFDVEQDQATKLGVFATRPAIPRPGGFFVPACKPFAPGIKKCRGHRGQIQKTRHSKGLGRKSAGDKAGTRREFIE